MLPFFLIQAHGAVKYIVKYVTFAIYVHQFAKDIAFLYHDILFVYITIIMRFYITIYRLSQLLWHHYYLPRTTTTVSK